MGENTADAPCWNRGSDPRRENPIRERAGMAVLRGNLAPNGAVIKPSAATPRLLKHRGRAVVFESIEDFKARIDRPDLEIDENSVMVLKGAGPKGYPGMPEVGNMPLPPKLLQRGITDLVRISDARMSGTAYGTVVLHVSPESAVGGPLAVVQNGDEIELDVDARKLELRVSDDELNRRRRPGNLRRRSRLAAISDFTSITCCRRTRARIWIFWSGAVGLTCPGKVTERDEGSDMKETWRWFGPQDPVTLEQIRQAGATGIVTALHHLYRGEAWPLDEVLRRKAEIEAAGFVWSVVESIPVHNSIKLRSADCRKFIGAWKDSLASIAKAGVRTVCYNFMPVVDWTRTDLMWQLPSTGYALRFDSVDFAVYDLFILARRNAEADYKAEEITTARVRFDQMSEARRQDLERTIIAGLPGAEGSYTARDNSRAPD